ncbi:MAG: hypothetical protein GY926_19630 [bacterium]|nr:hypothetical protein [bacterium]
MTLAAGNVTGGNDIVISSGDELRGVDATDATITGLTTRGGDYTGTGSDNAGDMVVQGGDSSSPSGGSTGGLLAMRGGSSSGGLARGFQIGGSIGNTTELSWVRGVDANSGNGAGDIEVAGGTATAGGACGVVTIHGGEPSTSDANNRPGGAVTIHGGDGGGGGLAGTHFGGTTTVRGGHGEFLGGGGHLVLAAGDAGSESNVPGGYIAVTGGASTGNTKGGDITLTPGASSGSGRAGITFIVPATSGSGPAGTMVIGSATEPPVTGNALNITGVGGRIGGYDVATNLTPKHVRLGVVHYTNASGMASVISGDTENGGNVVKIGGGDGSWNAATSIEFYTAANSTTTAGTAAGSINSSQDWTIGEDGGGAAHVVHGVSGMFRSESTDTANKSFSFVTTPYNTSEGNIRFLSTSTTNGANTMTIGGGSSVDGMTAIQFWTSSAVDTNATQRGVITTAGLLDWVGDVRGRTFFADGDEGTGIASTVAMTNVDDTDVAGSALAMTNNTGDGLAHAGFLKFYMGTTAIKVPYFT